MKGRGPRGLKNLWLFILSHPLDVDQTLPEALRASRLPWVPDTTDQSSAPAPDDSWCAVVGTLEWSLLAHQAQGEELPDYILTLRDLSFDEELSEMWMYNDVQTAAHVADAIHSTLLEQLRRELS